MRVCYNGSKKLGWIMELLYLDDRVVVCLKPPGVLSTDEPGGMPERLRAALDADGIRSVHRLDRAVGGVMVYARTRRAASDLSAQIREGVFQKEYWAVVRGKPTEPEGRMVDWLHRDRAARKTLVVPRDAPEAQEAVLEYRLLAHSGGLSLLSIRLLTGRTHQIRCQLASRGLPIVGDRKYGGEGSGDVALWSRSIAFLHPRSGESMRFTSAPPNAYPWAPTFSAYPAE